MDEEKDFYVGKQEEHNWNMYLNAAISDNQEKIWNYNICRDTSKPHNLNINGIKQWPL